MKRLLLILCAASALTGRAALTNTNYTATAQFVMTDTNGLVTYPLALAAWKHTNDLASASVVNSNLTELTSNVTAAAGNAEAALAASAAIFNGLTITNQTDMVFQPGYNPIIYWTSSNVSVQTCGLTNGLSSADGPGGAGDEIYIARPNGTMVSLWRDVDLVWKTSALVASTDTINYTTYAFYKNSDTNPIVNTIPADANLRSLVAQNYFTLDASTLWAIRMMRLDLYSKGLVPRGYGLTTNGAIAVTNAPLVGGLPASAFVRASDFQVSDAVTNSFMMVPAAAKTNVLVLIDGAGVITTQRVLSARVL